MKRKNNKHRVASIVVMLSPDFLKVSALISKVMKLNMYLNMVYLSGRK